MAATRIFVAALLLASSRSLLWSTNGEIVFEISLSLDNSSACMNTSLINSPEARIEVMNFIESYNLSVNITDPRIVSCSNGIINASFTSSSQLLTLCQLSSILTSENSSAAGQEDFLDYTIESTDGRPVNRSCTRAPDNFQMMLIIVLASSGGSALLIICCLGICMFSCQCVCESKRKKQSKSKHSSLKENEEIVQFNQYESRGTSKSSAHELKADQHSVDNYEALPASDFTTQFTTSCSVEVVPHPPPPPAIGQSVPQAPPPPPVGATSHPPPPPSAQVGSSPAPPPAPPPPPILTSSMNKESSKPPASMIPPPPPSSSKPPAMVPPLPSLPKVTATLTQQPKSHTIEEVYDSSDMGFSSHSTNPPFRQKAAEVEEIYDTGVSVHVGQLPSDLDMLDKFYEDVKVMEEDLGEDYETMDIMQHGEDEECGDYTDMDFDHAHAHDYVNHNPLSKIPENNELYY